MKNINDVPRSMYLALKDADNALSTTMRQDQGVRKIIRNAIRKYERDNVELYKRLMAYEPGSVL